MLGWVQLPTKWILEGGLRNFEWKTHKSNATVALLLLMVIGHHVEQDAEGVVRLTYDDFETTLGFSRTKISDGLELLRKLKIVEIFEGKRSVHRLSGPLSPWGKLPARPLYSRSGAELVPFKDFKLRQKAELDALKIFLFLVARRDNDQNLCLATYDQIEKETGVPKARIKSGLTMLYANHLVFLEPQRSTAHDAAIAHAYRIAHVDPYRHAGTNDRQNLRAEV
jgi:hypothetical protein